MSLPPPQRTDWLRHGRQAEGVDLFEAFFQGAAYGSHRHDSYAIGLTIAGVQSFRYRSSMRHSLSGQVLVLHPDEAHDGQPHLTRQFVAAYGIPPARWLRLNRRP